MSATSAFLFEACFQIAFAGSADKPGRGFVTHSRYAKTGLSDKTKPLFVVTQLQLTELRSPDNQVKGSATVLNGKRKIGIFQEEVSEEDKFAHEESEGEFFGFAVGEEAQVEGF